MKIKEVEMNLDKINAISEFNKVTTPIFNT